MPEAPAPQWVEAALEVTGHFESSTDPWAGVSGDFDGMGISLGVLQWNIGSGSLQRLVKPLGRAAVIGLMPHFGVDLWNACSTPIDEGLRIVRGWQSGATLQNAVKQELKAFCRSAVFRAQQVSGADRVARNALMQAQLYAADDPTFGGSVSKHLFCWFFDLLTQNGGLKTITYANVEDFINRYGALFAADNVCNWLAARTSADAGFRDSHKNAEAWRGKVTKEQLTLFILSYQRALVARTEYRADTLNRKGTIALGFGNVHMEAQDLAAILRE
jgi:hypothetical protein